MSEENNDLIGTESLPTTTGGANDPFGKLAFYGKGLTFANAWKTALFGNIPSLLPTALSVLFWFATLWIPYVNILTTLAIIGIPIKIARGQKISPPGIFTTGRKDRFFDILLLTGLISAAIGIFSTVSSGAFGLAALSYLKVGLYYNEHTDFWVWMKTYWMAIVAVVSMLLATGAWSLSSLLAYEHGMRPFDALAKSVELTRGKVLTLALIFAPLVVAPLFALLWLAGIEKTGYWLSWAVIFVTLVIYFRLLAFIWKELVEPPPTPTADETPTE